MAVAFDAKSTADTVSGTGVTSFTQTNLTIGASANALTYVAVFDANVSGISAHWDSTGTNQAMTVNFLWNATAAVGVAVCTLLNPTTGAKTFSISWTTASQVTVCGVSWTGAGSFGTFTTNTGTATTATVTPTGAGANDQMIAGHGSGNGPTFSAPNGTSVFIENATPASYTCAANRLAGPSAALTFTMSTSSPFLSGGIAIIASAAAAVAFSPTLFFEPTRKRPPTEFMQGPFAGTSPALVSPWVQAPFFDPIRLKQPSEFGPGPFAQTSPALTNPYWTSSFFDSIRLKQPVIDVPQVVVSPPVVAVILSLAPWFDTTRLKAVLTWQIDNVPPFTLEATPPTAAFFDRTQLLRPRLWDMDLPPAFTLEAPPPTTPFFDALRKLQVPDSFPFVKATTVAVTIQNALTDWFDRTKLKLPVVETPLVVYFPAQVLPTFPTVHNLPIIVTTGKLKSF